MSEKDFFVHSKALVESETIGFGTRIWAFAHVMLDVMIGRNCNIGDHCFIESNVRLGDDVVVKNGVSIWSGVTIEDRVFIGPNVAFTNDTVPRAKVFHAEYEHTLVREGASIGANATLLCGITVGRHALIGAGSVVTHDVPDFALVYGNPAQPRGWVCQCGRRLEFDDASPAMTCCTCGLAYRRHEDVVEPISLQMYAELGEEQTEQVVRTVLADGE